MLDKGLQNVAHFRLDADTGLTERITRNKMINNVDIKSLIIDDDGGVAVEWNDGHASRYEAKYLRVNCGCAECVEEWSKRQLLDPASVSANIRAEDHLMVGHYAVQFLWSDAHYTGIYPFDMLRALCICEECKLA